MGCDKCEGGFVFTRCCSGLSEMCGCMGYPVQVTNCKHCNTENKEPEDSDISELLKLTEFFD